MSESEKPVTMESYYKLCRIIFGVILLAQDFSPKSSGLTGSSCGLLVFCVGPFEVFDGSVLEVPDTGGDFID